MGLIAEGKELFASEGAFAEEALEDGALGEVLGMAIAAVNARAEKMRDPEEGGFGFHTMLDGGTEDDRREAARGDVLEEGAGAVDEVSLGMGGAGGDAGAPAFDGGVEAGLENRRARRRRHQRVAPWRAKAIAARRSHWRMEGWPLRARISSRRREWRAASVSPG